MIESNTTTIATTFTVGPVRGSRSWLKIQMGSVVCAPAVNVGHHDLVEGQGECQEAGRQQGGLQAWQDDEAERLPTVGPQVHRRLHERRGGPSKPGHNVVVDHHHAERGVPHDDREQAVVETEQLSAEHAPTSSFGKATGGGGDLEPGR
jgi:hypothetical protein